ncbi:Putative protein in type-1 retrotransposable element R1DM [Araneus ventricosus]|uniref:Retrovirus-related Pol polyprotein from type-1 retrotransposable element R1 n=1 Tax=Araneus ventricosus TaxID=182803 RepID=A0A4Y2A4L3_ARAVE|nr:Putative protein in type-1 retrotransposable element R1DM [Araneus ventricosus]
MISLDIKNAFNSINWTDIMQLLIKYKVPLKLLRLFNSFLSERTVVLEDCTRWEYNVGVPQGSSCGPILWLLVANEALRSFIENENVLVQAFADDFVILLKATASYKFSDMSKDIMLQFEQWTSTYNLKFSESKSKYIMFKVSKNITHFPGIYLYEKRISYTNDLKYLGIVFDPGFTFMTHLNRVQEKIIKINENLRRIRATWGIRPEMTKEIYLTILERIILYGVEIWYRDKVKINMKLLQIQRYPLLSITRTYKTTSNEALQVLSGCIPFDLKAQMQVEIDSKIRGVVSFSDPSVIDFEKEEKLPPWEVIRINWNFFLEVNKHFSIFTDGSKMNGRVGCAFVLYVDDIETNSFMFRLSDNYSVFMAEVYAIYKAVEEIRIRNLHCVDIISDSRSALMALNSLRERRNFINEIKRKVIAHQGIINFKWVRAHRGTAGNERADVLAKTACEKEIVDVFFDTTKAEIKFDSKRQALSLWQERWTLSRKGTITKKFFNKVSLKRVKVDFYINQIYTGHGIFRTYQNRFFDKSIECHCGEAVGDAEHVLFRCKLWEPDRESPRLNFNLSLLELLRVVKFRQFCRFVIQSLLNLEIT